ncbi:hypothetical protein KKG71_05965, partial [Patescibacteria group bacterium]|nr:hypothetical protein [Patescibacteria group bacterium]
KVEGETDEEMALNWIGMITEAKKSFEIKIGGKNMKLGAIAGELGEAGLHPTSNPDDFKRLGIVLFGEKAIELYKERIIEAVKAKVEGETDEEMALNWIGMITEAKKSFEIKIGGKKMKIGAIAGALGEVGLRPASNPDDFKRLGIVLFGEKAIELYKERIIEAVKAKVEGETDVEKAFVWVGMTKVEKNAFEIKIGGKNMKLGAIAGALGEAGLNPTSNSADFKRLGIKIFGDHDCFN